MNAGTFDLDNVVPTLMLSLLGGLGGGITVSFCSFPAIAQPLVVRPDGLTQTVVEGALDCRSDCTITGQPIAGESLFHSFSQFSLAEGVTVTFEDAGARNIFARVSDEISTINGTLAVTGVGDANLFLLNPHGIVFGPSAELSLAGSFIASSAESVIFPNDVQFGPARHDSSALTISTPIGLQFGNQPGAIVNRSQALSSFPMPVRDPVSNLLDRPSGLKVAAHQTVALLGQGVFIDGGNVTANGGRIEIGSVAQNSLISLISGFESDERIVFGYGKAVEFSDVDLTENARLDVGGDQGDIVIRGRNISIAENSSVANFSAGLERPGKISLIADERIEVSDSFILFPRVSGGGDRGAELNVMTNQLLLKDGSVFLGATIGPMGNGGNITINAFESVELSGASLDTPNYITASSLGGGSGGDITINTGRLLVADGSQIESLAGNSGPGGDIDINATDRVEVRGAAPTATASVANRLLNGAGVVLESTSTGPSVSRIVATSGIEEVDSSQATGLGGSLTINTGTLVVSDRAQVSVGSFGPGDSGALKINARHVWLDERAQLSAASVLGDGGNLRLEGLETLILRHGSRVTARAQSGTGGNIFIDSDFVLAHPLEDSDIVASATNGQGGNIEINTQGVYGIEPRKATPNNGTNDIDASSDFGVSGTTAVKVVTSQVDLTLPTLMVQPIDEATAVTQRCDASGNRFVVSARGGIPLSPADTLTVNSPLVDLGLEHDLEQTLEQNVTLENMSTQLSLPQVSVGVVGHEFSNSDRSNSEHPNSAHSNSAHPNSARPDLVEARGWHHDVTGQVRLTAQSEESSRLLAPLAYCNSPRTHRRNP